jgi:hypothetical protein
MLQCEIERPKINITSPPCFPAWLWPGSLRGLFFFPTRGRSSNAGPFIYPAELRSGSGTDAMTSWNFAMSATSFKDVPPISPVPVAWRWWALANAKA